MIKRGRRCKQLLDDVKEKRRHYDLKGSTKSHSVANSIWKRLWSCRKIDNKMNELSYGGVTVRSVGGYRRVSGLERMWHKDVVTK